MHKLGFSGLKSLDQFKSLSGSIPGTAKTFSVPGRPSSDSITLGSFANLKLTAEKLVKEQASVKTDLEMANSKLKKSMEDIQILEEKLQYALNENAKLKVKQKEDEKLWTGLESKFFSTKTLCEQLTETLQHLACQVQDAEKDKELFEDKLSASSVAFDGLNDQMNGLSLKLESAEESIKNYEKELKELKIQREEREQFHRDEQYKTANLLEEKDAMIKQFEATVAASRLATESLNSKLEEVHIELRLKEDEFKHLIVSQENLEKEKSHLQLSNDDFAKRLALSLHERKIIEDLVQKWSVKLIDLDKQSLDFSDKFDQLNHMNCSYVKLAQQERDLAAKHSQQQYAQLHHTFLCIASEKDALQLKNQVLNNKVVELQEAHNFVTAQLAEECRLAGEKIQTLESEVENLVSRKIDKEMLVTKLEEIINTQSESLKSSENKMKDLLLKLSTLETENKDNTEKLQAEILKRADEIEILQKEGEKDKQHVDSLENQVSQLQNILQEKEQLILQYKDRVKQLEVQNIENQASLDAAESKITETKKQYDLMLETKQLELSRHLKEISQRNDQAINDIRKKYEVEKLEIINLEKEKMDEVVREMERKCDQKLAECKEESRLYLMHIQEEHTNLITRIQQEHDRKELSLKADHSEELKRVQLQAEDDLREKTILLRNEHEVQIKVLRHQHEDECKKLQEELDRQKSREDRQRALLQLQWKVMSDKTQEDPEVNSKKDYSISSIKMRDSSNRKRSQCALVRVENREKDSPFPGAIQTPVSNLLKKVENVNPGSAISVPKHSKKVTHHEYEVETTNGRTITKRRKTKSTVMFGDPRKHKKANTPKAHTPRTIVKEIKGDRHLHPSNIGELFSEGSLNPYADDPYAFD
ncbi:synaptonemal complex protein 1-like isoform X1 [Vitis riparia]|uniref:synaptonemal complex protein 1-like isoform X1 n=2 Tax=Vitis riparia TaxID=96939 RepID=UPI00155A5F1E|nr:synaptonemal complex protein 1-like isoform X1 [Vitis riparia]